MDKFWSKVDKSGGVEACWIWTGAMTGSGYGAITIARKTGLAHRRSYELIIGTIPENLELDHLCRNRGCVNPSHLEAVTHAENVRRGLAVQATREAKARITHCPHGHEYSESNTRMYQGRRFCKACDTAKARRLAADPEKKAIDLARRRVADARRKHSPEYHLKRKQYSQAWWAANKQRYA